MDLEIRGLRKRFGGVTALDGIDLTVGRGEAVAVIGPNGAGKSTLLKAISGMNRPDEGHISFGRHTLDRLPPQRITRLGVALAHQVPRPFGGLTVRDNVRVGSMAASPRMRHAELDEILALCQLEAKSSRLAGSLRILDLKRLEVARALATRPQLLMLDEVAAGLVGRELDEVIELIRAVHARGVTILLVEHIERVVREVVDRVLVLDWGRPIAHGTPSQIAADPAVRAVYLGDGSRPRPPGLQDSQRQGHGRTRPRRSERGLRGPGGTAGLLPAGEGRPDRERARRERCGQVDPVRHDHGCRARTGRIGSRTREGHHPAPGP